MTVAEYLKRKNALTNTTYIRKGGKGVYLVQGKEVPEEKFKAENRLPVTLLTAIENPDSRKTYLG
jgi:hypothetical protein